jgi:excisionase family DNA binding protein
VTDYNARIEYATRTPIDDELIDALGGHGPATGRTDTGWVEVHITLDAPDLTQAIVRALALGGRAHSTPLLGLEVIPTAEFDARVQAGDEPSGTIGVPEAAELLGVTASAVRQRLAHGSIPGERVGRDWRISRAVVARLAGG